MWPLATNGKPSLAGHVDFAYSAPNSGRYNFSVTVCGTDMAGVGCNKLNYTVVVKKKLVFDRNRLPHRLPNLFQHLPKPLLLWVKILASLDARELNGAQWMACLFFVMANDS